MQKNKKSKLKVITTVTIATLASTFALSTYLVDYAINRKQPKLLIKTRSIIPKSLDKRRFYSNMSKKSKELTQKAHKVIQIISHDSIVLEGHLFQRENAKRTILAMHGWRSGWSRDFGIISDFLLNSQSNILFIEQRGQNNSEGDYIGLGLVERYDCLDWINWINTHLNSEIPIYLYGISMGASTALMSTGFDLPSNVKGVIADCGYTSPEKICKYVLHKKVHMLFGIKKFWSRYIIKHRIKYKSNAYSTLDAMKKCKVPILFIHGLDDKFVPVEMTYQNFEACASEKKMLIVPKAEHAMSYFMNPNEYEKALTEFWNKYDN